MLNTIPSLMIIAGDGTFAERVADGARELVPNIVQVDGLVTAFRQLENQTFAAIIIDTRLAEVPYRELLARLNYRNPDADIIAAFDDPGALREQAFSFGCTALIRMDIDPDEIQRLLKRIDRDRQQVEQCGWVGKSPQIRTVSSLLLTAAPSAATVLLTGESGTGKELAARAIHENSPRKSKPYLAINCSAFAEGVLESELFGHEKGAFTHAFAQKQGIFEAAHGGTIFLDEIGEMPPGLQAKLLRVLEEKRIRRVGGTVSLEVDVRVIAASNRDLAAASTEYSFRRDLYFRLSVIRLEMPRLLDRLFDIPLLVQAFMQSSSDRQQPAVSDDAYDAMLQYHWPGNVRELRNFVERLAVLAPGQEITAHVVQQSLAQDQSIARNLPARTGSTPETVRDDMILAALAELKRDLNQIKQAIGLEGTRPRHVVPGEETEDVSERKPTNLTRLEIETIKDALRQVNGNRRKAAKLLGIGERTLYRKIRQYGL